MVLSIKSNGKTSLQTLIAKVIKNLYHYSCVIATVKHYKKKQIDKKVSELNFDANNSKKYIVNAFQDSAIYASKAKSYLPRLYYLVAYKSYLKEENVKESLLAVQHLKKLMRSFYQKY